MSERDKRKVRLPQNRIYYILLIGIITSFIIGYSFPRSTIIRLHEDTQDLNKTLQMRARREGRTVAVVTRPPTHSYYLKLHQWLKETGITILYFKDFHARLF